ncbi:unnamed protein product [Protopolystoma xenopodis]|uniref:Uncharacterized protein n=1 Tax=Protopolystoma xenopodis TaxID=117903 RepID=A0A448X7B0_9PLAT|nr:unnamed protein product [Protopolystoma xenopodis]
MKKSSYVVASVIICGACRFSVSWGLRCWARLRAGGSCALSSKRFRDTAEEASTRDLVRGSGCPMVVAGAVCCLHSSQRSLQTQMAVCFCCCRMAKMTHRLLGCKTTKSDPSIESGQVEASRCFPVKGGVRTR